MKTLNTLVDDVYSLFDPEKTHTPDEDNLNEFAENLKQLLRVRLATREKTSGTLRFSNLGKPDRQIWYEAQGEVKEELTARTYWKFLYGDVIEALMLFFVKEAGHEVTDEQREIEVDGVKGHIDCKIDGVVVDVKSCNQHSFKKFEGNDFYEDVFLQQYMNQLCGYSNVLTPGEPPAFLAVDKVTGNITVAPVGASVAKDFKPEERIQHLKEVIASPAPPSRCYDDEPDGKSGNRKLSVGCSYCGFRNRCWPGLRTFLYSSGPRYLTHVEKTPEVFEVT